MAGSVNWRSFEGMQNARDQSATMHRKADTLRGSIAVRQIRNEAMELLGSLSLASVPTFIRRWPFVDGKVHPLLDFHRCFGFERMHNLHLGVGRTICSMISERLAEGDSVSTQLVSSSASQGNLHLFASPPCQLEQPADSDAEHEADAGSPH
jgi:hypothetical protein